MPNVKKLEFFRKAWHSLNGLLVVALYQFNFLSKDQLVFSLKLIFVFSVLFEALRFHHKRFNRKLIRLASPIIRKSERKQISGIPFYALGCLFSIYFFSKEVAVLSVLYLAIGDSVASLSGRKWGDLGFRFRNGKSLAGLLGGISSCTILSVSYFGLFTNRAPSEFLIISILGGTIGGLSELCSVIDDNVFIPVLSSIGLHLLLTWF